MDEGVDSEYDPVAIVLIILQALLLYKIAQKAELLRGPRLLAAVQAARERAAAR